MFLGARGENEFKLVQKNLEKNLRKEIQKKIEKGQALLGQPRLPFGPDSGPACLPLPLSPARGRPPRPSQRRPRGGRTPAMGAPRPTGFTWSGRRPGLPGRPIRFVARALLLPASARERNRAVELRHSAIAGAAPLLTAGHFSDQTSTPKPPAPSPSLG